MPRADSREGRRKRPLGLALLLAASTVLSGVGLAVGPQAASADDTPALLKDLNVGAGSSSPTGFAQLGASAYFLSTDPATRGLWKTDATAAGTTLLKSFSVVGVPLTTMAGALYFFADDGIAGLELWKTDGTTAGTVRVKDVNPGPAGSVTFDPFRPFSLLAVGGAVYFSATDGVTGSELWKSDGTTAGTVLLKDVYVGNNSTGSGPRNFTAIGSTMFFEGFSTIGSELWKTDGTTAGTVLVKDVDGPGQNGLGGLPMVAVGTTLYFAGQYRPTPTEFGLELWKSDGTAAGTVMVKDIHPNTTSSGPVELTALGNKVLFTMDDGTTGRELWISDGTAAGTALVKDIFPGATSSTPSDLTALGGTVFFYANDGVSSFQDGGELWKTDGTAAGTVLVKDIRPGTADSLPRHLSVVGSTLYFTAQGTFSSNRELWKSDGSAAGTLQVAEINPTGSAFPGTPQLTPTLGRLFFPASNGTAGVEPWVTGLIDPTVSAFDDGYTTNEDTTLTRAAPGVLANDVEYDAATLTASLVAGTAHGALTFNANGSFTYIPAANYNGLDQFTYQVDDGLTSKTATAYITVAAVNDAPVAVNNSYMATEDVTLIMPAPGVLGNDTDADGNPLTAVKITDPANGTLTLNADGSFTYRGAANYSGPDSFTYRANDGTANSNVATVSLTVTGFNDAPVAVNNTYSANEDSPLTPAAPGVLGNDTDVEGNPLTASKVSDPAHGTVTLNANGSFTYTPAANYNGPDSFTYRANDGTANSNVATVSITVLAVNDAPQATGDSYSTSEDTPLSITAPGVLANDTDVEGSPLTAVKATDPLHGTVTLNANGSFTYTPAANYAGPDSFQYRANDGTTNSAPTSVTFSIVNVNDAPVAADDTYSTAEDSTLALVAPGLLANDSDIDGSPLTATKQSNPAHGTVTVAANGSFSYVPVANYNGPDSFTYSVFDGTASSNVATVNITVTPVNDAPVAAGNSYSTAEDATLTVATPGVLGNDTDVDGNPLTAVLVTGPAQGTLTLNGNGSFTYVPAANANGPVSFTYRASDGALSSNLATVTISVTAVNDAPVAANNTYSTAEDTTLTVTAPGVLANDTDVEGSPLTALVQTNPAHGTVTLNANGSFSYVPAANYNGPDSFTYRASDGALSSNVATMSISVTAVNDAPVAISDSHTTAEDTALTVTAPGVLGNDTDIDSGTLTAVKVTDPARGSVTLNANGSFSYVPNANANGADSFTYRVFDGALSSTVATVNINVTAVNDAPVAASNSYSTLEDTTLGVSPPGVLGNDTDIDGNPLTAVKVTDPAKGTLTLGANGSLTYIPNANANGADSFSYRASDGILSSNVATVNITVTPVNDAPVAVDDSYVTAEDVPLTVAAPGLMANDTDIEGNPLTAVLATSPAHGTVTVNANGSFSYTPAANYNGPDAFTYRVTDGTLSSSVAVVNLTVSAVNDAPVAAADVYLTAENTALSPTAPGVLGNDTDVDGSSLTAVKLTEPAHGTVTLNGDGSFSYVPVAGYAGPDGFTYQASDGALASNVATVTITVSGVNDAPVAVDDAFTTAEDTVLAPAAPGLLENDSDADGNPLTAIKVSGPDHGAVTVNGDGSFSYVPPAGYSGPDSFTYQASDGALDSNVATVTITVTAVNDVPAAANDAYTTDEDTVLVPAAGVLANDTDADDDPLTAAKVTDPVHGTVTLNPDGSFAYTPDAQYNGPDSFTYQANDGTADSDLATVTITVNAVNDGPAANDDAYTATEDTVLTPAAGLLGNDTDADGNPLTAAKVTDPAHGTVTLNPDGTFTYTPDPQYNGLDNFTYQATDGTTDSNVATVAITVNAVNDAPAAEDDAYTATEDTVLTPAAGVLANDTDADGNPLTAATVTNPAHGTVVLNADGSFSYTPDANYNGPDSFTYEASDGTAASDVATVAITVTAVNDPPAAEDDAYPATEDTVLTPAAGVLANDTDADGDALIVIKVTNPAHGTLTLNGDGSFAYTPDAGYSGPDSFDYKASDGTADSDVATVTITVNPANDAPVADDDAHTTDEDTVLALAAPGVLENDTDADGQTLTAVKVTDPAHGTLTLNGDGSFSYTPNAGYHGSDSFTYTANDGTADSNVATVTIAVDAVNDAPVADDDAYTTTEDTVLAPTAPGVLGDDTDADGDPLTATKVTDPAHGTLTLNGDGSFSYTPDAGYNGPDAFTYQANDGTVDSDAATVTITVNAVNDAPVAADDAYTTAEDTLLALAAPGVLGNDTDPDGQPLTAVKVTDPAHGAVTVNADGSFSYTPDANYSGPDSFTYQANDGTVDSDVATVTITVASVNDAPVAVDDSYLTAEGTPLTVTAPGVLGNDTDTDSDPLDAIKVSDPGHGTVTVDVDGSISYTPAAGYNGPDSFTYKANDGDLDSTVATVNITVTPVNDAPVAVDDSFLTAQNTPLTINPPGVLGNDTDGDGDALAASKVTDPAHGAVALASDGSFSYTPAAGYSGPDSFTYRASDGTADSNVAAVAITVTAPDNTPPAAVEDAYTTGTDVTLTVGAPGVLDNDTDADGDGLTAGSASAPGGGAVTLDADGSFSYTPNAGFSGSDSFTYVASDGKGGSAQATVTLTVIAPTEPPTLAINDVRAREGDAGLTPATFTVTRFGTVTGTSTVKYKTSGSTASAGIDFVSVAQATLSFGPGETAKTVTVSVVGDTVPEPDERFRLTLSAPSQGTVVDRVGKATIVNDDATTQLSVDSVRVTEGNAGVTPATFTVTRSGTSSTAVAVSYQTSGGTATAGTDYTGVPLNTLTFAAGETTKTVAVDVIGDVTDESDETFALVLSAPVGAAIANGSGTGTIVDDDGTVSPGPGTFLSVASLSVVEGSSGTTAATFVVTRTGDLAGTSTVKAKTSAGTASSRSDYTAVGLTTITFGPGQASQTFTVNVTGDTDPEVDETFNLVLSKASAGTTITNRTATATIIDDD